MSASYGKRRWQPRHPATAGDLDARISELQAQTGLSPLTLRVCLQRGLENAEQITRYLSPRLDQLTDPMKILGMAEAVERLAQAKLRGEKVRVFGDYDVDGTCGAALLT